MAKKYGPITVHPDPGLRREVDRLYELLNNLNDSIETQIETIIQSDEPQRAIISTIPLSLYVKCQEPSSQYKVIQNILDIHPITIWSKTTFVAFTARVNHTPGHRNWLSIYSSAPSRLIAYISFIFPQGGPGNFFLEIIFDNDITLEPGVYFLVPGAESPSGWWGIETNQQNNPLPFVGGYSLTWLGVGYPPPADISNIGLITFKGFQRQISLAYGTMNADFDGVPVWFRAVQGNVVIL